MLDRTQYHKRWRRELAMNKFDRGEEVLRRKDGAQGKVKATFLREDDEYWCFVESPVLWFICLEKELIKVKKGPVYVKQGF